MFSHQVIEQLFFSLRELEQAISQTKVNLAGVCASKPELVQRLECYEEVLRKQKVLAENLQRQVDNENWEQVARYVELIRGSSLLIQLDSQSMIEELHTPESKTQNYRELLD